MSKLPGCGSLYREERRGEAWGRETEVRDVGGRGRGGGSNEWVFSVRPRRAVTQLLLLLQASLTPDGCRVTAGRVKKGRRREAPVLEPRLRHRCRSRSACTSTSDAHTVRGNLSFVSRQIVWKSLFSCLQSLGI